MRGQIFGRWLFWELPKGKRESFLADVSFLRIEVLWARESFLELKCFYRKRGIFLEGEEYLGEVRCRFSD